MDTQDPQPLPELFTGNEPPPSFTPDQLAGHITAARSDYAKLWNFPLQRLYQEEMMTRPVYEALRRQGIETVGALVAYLWTQ